MPSQSHPRYPATEFELRNDLAPLPAQILDEPIDPPEWGLCDRCLYIRKLTHMRIFHFPGRLPEGVKLCVNCGVGGG